MFTNVTNPLHVRNGGLIGLAGTAIALGVGIAPYMEKFVDPLLNCFSDVENRVRYFSAECLYNIAKVSKGEILVYFNSIFDALSKVSFWFVRGLVGSACSFSGLSWLRIQNFPSRTVPNCSIGSSRISSQRRLLYTFLNFRRHPKRHRSCVVKALESLYPTPMMSLAALISTMHEGHSP